MAALIRSTRVPFWGIFLRRPSSYGLRTSSDLYRRANLSCKLYAQCSLRCISMSSMASVKVAAVETERSLGGQQVDRMITAMDRNVRRFGRLSQTEIENVLRKMEEDGTVTDTHSLLLIRCLGSTLAELKPGDRTLLLEEVCQRLKALGAEFGIQHYNALLMVYLQNEHKFSPSDFLAMLEANKVTPNRVTYQRLVARYCQEGDIKGASQILEHMKTQELPINEQVFSALVTGHFRANDVESAVGMLDIMEQAGVEVGIDTNLAFLNGYAERGDMSGLRQTQEKAAARGTTLPPSVLFNTVLTLARKGWEKEALEVLGGIEKLPGFSTEAMSCCLQLISLGLDDVAFSVFSSIGKPVVYDRDEASLGRFLIRGMVRSQRSPEKVSAMLDKMRADGFNNDTISLIPQFAYNNNQPEYALEVIDYMKNQGLPVRPHYFWPAICQYRDRGDKEKLKLVMQRLQESCDSQEDRFQTLDNYILPALLKLGVPLQDFHSELQSSGYSLQTVNFAYMLHLIRTEGYEKGLEYGRNNPVNVFYAALRPLLVPLYKETKDFQSVLQVLKFVEEVGQIPSLRQETTGWFLTDFFNNIRSVEEKEGLLIALNSMNLTIFRQDAEEVRGILSRSNAQLSSEAEQALDQISQEDSSSRRQRGSGSNERLMNLSIDELEAKLKVSPENKSYQKYLLVKYCQVGESQKAADLKEKLDSVGFMYSDFLLRQLAFLEAAHNQNLTAARSYLHQLLEQYPNYEDYLRVLLNVTALQISKGEPDEAMASLRKYCDEHSNFISSKRLDESYMLEKDLERIITAAVETGRIDLAKDVLHIAFDKQLIPVGSANILRKYISGFIANEDSDGVVDAMGWVITNYGKTPAINEVMKMLIRKEDPERLQKVVDLAASQRGEMSVLHHLLVAFIECGDVKKAKKIVETPGLRAVMPVLSFSCKLFVREGRYEELQNLVAVTKTLFAADRDELLFHLLRYHALAKNWPASLSVLVDYEEEGIQPRGRTLRYLAKALTADKQPVPFEVPKTHAMELDFEKDGDEGDSTLTSREQRGLSLLKSGGISAVQDMYTELLEADNKAEATSFITKIAHTVIDQNRFTDFTKLVQQLANMGDVDMLVQLSGEDFPDRQLWIVTQRLFIAYLHSGRGDEILTQLESSPATADRYLMDNGFYVLVENHPHLIPRYEQLAKKLAEIGSLKATNQLWTYYYCNGEDTKAEDLLKEHPEMLDTMRVFKTCRHALDTKQEGRLTYLANLLKGKNEIALGTVYRHLILYHLYNQDVAAIERVLAESAADGTAVRNIGQRARSALTALFQAHEKPLPEQLVYLQNSNVDDQSSSSSSSSDENEETSRR